MSKIISFLVLMAFIYGTWHWSHTESNVTQADHIELSSMVESEIRAIIFANFINIDDVVFNKLWTEKLKGPSKIRAHFDVSLVSEISPERKEGYIDFDLSEEAGSSAKPKVTLKTQTYDFIEPERIQATPPNNKESEVIHEHGHNHDSSEDH